MAKEYNPGDDEVIEFTIKRVRFGGERGFKVTCGTDGWSALSHSEAGAAREFGEHISNRHRGKKVRKVG